MKRILTKIGAIIDTVLYGLLAALCSLLFGLILSGSVRLMELDVFILDKLFTAVLILIIFIISIVGLVFSIKAISFSRESLEAYRNKYPLLISNVVFNSMFAVLLIFIDKNPSLIGVVILGCFIACGILFVVDMARNSIMLEKLENSKNENTDENGDEREEQNSANDLESQLKKLSELKEQNLITEKEYTSLREKLVKQEIEKDN